MKQALFRTRGWTFLLLLAALVLGSVAYFGKGGFRVQLVCASIAVALGGLAAAVHMAGDQRLFDSLTAGQLGPWFAASSSIVFGLASLIWLSPPAPYGSLISKGSVLSAMFIAAVAVVFFAAGYLIAPRRPVIGSAEWLRHVVMTERPRRPGQATAWLLLRIAFAAYLGQIAIGRFGYLANPAAALSSGNPFSQILSVVGYFSVFAVALPGYDYARRGGRRQLLSSASLLAAVSIAGAFSGNKEILALGLIAAFLGYVAGGRRIPLAWVAAAALIFVFVVVPFTTTFRSQVAISNTRLSPVEVIQAVSKRGLALFVPSQGQSPALQTVQRISRVGDVAIIVQRSKPSDLSYRPLTEVLEAPLPALLPILIRPVNPTLSTRYDFGKQYYGFPTSQYSASAITPESY